MTTDKLINLIIAPHVSEKSTRISDAHRQVVFRVLKSARKLDIKKAVELLFEVKVQDVRVANVNGKRKSTGRMAGRRSDWKKAYVTLKEGYDLDFLGAE